MAGVVKKLKACPRFTFKKQKKGSPYHDKDRAPLAAPQYGYSEVLSNDKQIVLGTGKKKTTIFNLAPKSTAGSSKWLFTGDAKHIYQHLRGAFWRRLDTAGSQQERNCQLIILNIRKKASIEMKCEASKSGSELAMMHLDLVHYNLYMLSAQHASTTRGAAPLYIYYAGKQKENHCTMFALNNALQFSLFDEINYKLPGKGTADFPFPFECFNAALTKAGLTSTPVAIFAKSKRSLALYGISPDGYQRQLKPIGFTAASKSAPEDVVAKVFNMISPSLDNAAHMVTFKLMQGQWYGFDANVASVQGPFADFEKAFANVLANSHKVFTNGGKKKDGFKWMTGIVYDLKPAKLKANARGSGYGYGGDAFEPDNYGQWDTLETLTLDFSAVMLMLLVAACICLCAGLFGCVSGFVGGSVLSKYRYIGRKDESEDRNEEHLFRQV